ncbi:hypothetical protein HW555_010204 [Spodoptera exigua]|uniref:Uncharacterized protein n=1 Tax=Spodoptera exigua TaxID=7107 RepID=A0A835GBI6_SPOEX|nr:hypothetical protein HW555_010204 [Spodoptera exigua]
MHERFLSLFYWKPYFVNHCHNCLFFRAIQLHKLIRPSLMILKTPQHQLQLQNVLDEIRVMHTETKKTIKSPCKCRMKCFDKISNSQRHRLLKDFWGLGDHHRQWSFVSNLVTRNPKRRIFTDKPDSRRKYTIKYRLPVPNVDENQSVTYVNVCKTQFLATFSISEQFVYTAIEKTEKATGIIECDGRGKHDKHPRKITDVIKQSVCDHIKSLQPVEAHYVRKDSARLYLDGDLNFHKLFSLYNEWIDLRFIMTRPRLSVSIKLPIYNNPIPIPKAKRDDLISLCDSGIIPSSHHDFYRNLTFIDSTRALPTSDTESE